MLKLKKGSKVPFPEKLSEGYSFSSPYFTANVNADKIRAVVEHFLAIQNELLFFILELPSKMDEETEVRPGVTEAFHKDVYYIDGCTKEEASVLFSRTADLLINDGLCAFGFGCHQSYDEIMADTYNIVSIFTQNEKKYQGFFEEHGINRVDTLVTAWDTFTQDTPGESMRIDTDGKSVYDIPDLFRDWGIYLAEKRES